MSPIFSIKLAILIGFNQLIGIMAIPQPATISLYKDVAQILQVPLNEDMAYDILRRISFEQADDMGATEQELEFIAKTNPPLALNNLHQFPVSKELMCNISNIIDENRTFLFYNPHDQMPGIIMRPNALRYLLKNEFSLANQSLSLEQKFDIDVYQWGHKISNYLRPFSGLSRYFLMDF